MRYNLSKITRWVSDGAGEYPSSSSFWCFFIIGMLLMIIFSACFCKYNYCEKDYFSTKMKHEHLRTLQNIHSINRY